MTENNGIAITGQDSPVHSLHTKAGRSGHPTGRVSKQQWMRAALDALVVRGVEGVRITELARTLSISKSGFYWHFDNRDHLLQEMTSFWINEYSQQIISEVLEQDEPLKKRLLKLVQLIREKKAGKFDLAFTSWAKRDPSVHLILDQVRDMRIGFLKSLLATDFSSDAELNARAHLFVVYFSWSEVMFRKSGTALEDEPLDTILEIISGKA